MWQHNVSTNRLGQPHSYGFTVYSPHFTACNFHWKMFHIHGISNFLVSPFQFWLYFNSFMHHLFKVWCRDSENITHCLASMFILWNFGGSLYDLTTPSFCMPAKSASLGWHQYLLPVPAVSRTPWTMATAISKCLEWLNMVNQVLGTQLPRWPSVSRMWPSTLFTKQNLSK